MLITLNLITSNVYTAVKAPTNRGFSFIEIWYVGVEIPILIGILEYGFLLGMKKYSLNMKKYNYPSKKVQSMTNKEKFDIDEFALNVDKQTFFITAVYIVVFNIVYWITAVSYLNR